MNNELKFYIDKTYHDSLYDDFEKYLSSDVGMLLSYVGEYNNGKYEYKINGKPHFDKIIIKDNKLIRTHLKILSYRFYFPQVSEGRFSDVQLLCEDTKGTPFELPFKDIDSVCVRYVIFCLLSAIEN